MDPVGRFLRDLAGGDQERTRCGPGVFFQWVRRFCACVTELGPLYCKNRGNPQGIVGSFLPETPMPVESRANGPRRTDRRKSQDCKAQSPETVGISETRLD